MTTMNRETKAVADVACERFVYGSNGAIGGFLERHDDQKRAVKELAKLIKGFYEYDLHRVENANLNIAIEVLRVALKLVDFDAAAKYCIDTYLGFAEK